MVRLYRFLLVYTAALMFGISGIAYADTGFEGHLDSHDDYPSNATPHVRKVHFMDSLASTYQIMLASEVSTMISSLMLSNFYVINNIDDFDLLTCIVEEDECGECCDCSVNYFFSLFDLFGSTKEYHKAQFFIFTSFRLADSFYKAMLTNNKRPVGDKNQKIFIILVSDKEIFLVDEDQRNENTVAVNIYDYSGIESLKKNLALTFPQKRDIIKGFTSITVVRDSLMSTQQGTLTLKSSKAICSMMIDRNYYLYYDTFDFCATEAYYDPFAHYSNDYEFLRKTIQRDIYKEYCVDDRRRIDSWASKDGSSRNKDHKQFFIFTSPIFLDYFYKALLSQSLSLNKEVVIVLVLNNPIEDIEQYKRDRNVTIVCIYDEAGIEDLKSVFAD